MYRVLLVDDEELALISLSCSFPWKEYGFTEIITTTDSQSALNYLLEQDFDAAFVDIRMPGISGLELIALAQQNNVNTHFVIVSGYSEFSYAQEALRLNALDYCLKPVMPEDTAPILERLCSRILQQRFSHDPAFISSLISDHSICEKYLKNLGMGDLNESVTLMHIRSVELSDLLKKMDSLSPCRILFYSPFEALLIWNHLHQENQFLEHFDNFSSSSLMITCNCDPTVEAFQFAVNQLLTEIHNHGEKEHGLITLSSVCPEMTEYFSKVLSYTNEHYSEKLSLSELSRTFGINYTYLSQLFKKKTKKSFPEYLTDIRLSHACQLLSGTKMKISLISEHVGFNDYHYFCNVFKRTFSMSPLQFRNNAALSKGVDTDEKI